MNSLTAFKRLLPILFILACSASSSFAATSLYKLPATYSFVGMSKTADNTKYYGTLIGRYNDKYYQFVQSGDDQYVLYSSLYKTWIYFRENSYTGVEFDPEYDPETGLIAGLDPSLFADYDTDGDGASDYWEMTHADGDYMNPEVQPEANEDPTVDDILAGFTDEDGDGVLDMTPEELQDLVDQGYLDEDMVDDILNGDVDLSEALTGGDSPIEDAVIAVADDYNFDNTLESFEDTDGDGVVDVTEDQITDLLAPLYDEETGAINLTEDQLRDLAEAGLVDSDMAEGIIDGTWGEVDLSGTVMGGALENLGDDEVIITVSDEFDELLKDAEENENDAVIELADEDEYSDDVDSSSSDIDVDDSLTLTSQLIKALGLDLDKLGNYESEDFSASIYIPVGGTINNLLWKEISFSLNPSNLPSSQSDVQYFLTYIRYAIKTFMNLAISWLFFKNTYNMLWSL